ncbi:MAG: mechanosensitive ion channel family protein [Myxococcota bacterium]
MAVFDEALGQLLAMGESLGRALPRLGVAIIVFVVVLAFGGLVGRTIRASSRRFQEHRSLGIVVARLARWLVTLAGLLVAATIVFPSITPATLIEFLGIGSVAIGFAFRDVLQNFLAGLLILATRPFRLDDQIVFGAFEGTVEEIQTRATLIRTYDNRRVVIPNAKLFTEGVVVNTAYPHRRVEVEVGVGMGDDLERARAVILEAMRGTDEVLSEPAPDTLVVAIGDFATIVRCRFWIHPPRRKDHLEVQDRVLTAIRRRLAEEGIDLPYPTHQVLFHDQTEATDGDRSRQREGWPAGERPPKPATVAGALSRLAGAVETATERLREKSPV